MTRPSRGHGRATRRNRITAAATPKESPRRSKATPPAKPRKKTRQDTPGQTQPNSLDPGHQGKSGQEALEQAALSYARELPSVVARAIRRAARGKPTPLLRSLTRILRETGALLEEHQTRKRSAPVVHPQLGQLDTFELHYLAQKLHALRLMNAGQRTTGPGPTTLDFFLSEPDFDLAPHMTPEPAQQTPGEIPVQAQPRQVEEHDRKLWDGIERRKKHIPASVFLGKLERRRARAAGLLKIGPHTTP